MKKEKTVIDLAKPPESGITHYVCPNGPDIIHTDEGALLIHEDGSRIVHKPDGETIGMFPRAKLIQVDSLAEIEAHEIHREGEVTEHILTFKGGGRLGCTVIKGQVDVTVFTQDLGFSYDMESGLMRVRTTLAADPVPLERTFDFSCISDVVSHQICKTMNMTTHVIQICQGYEIQYAYNQRGENIHQSLLESGPATDRDGNSIAGQRQTMGYVYQRDVDKE